MYLSNEERRLAGIAERARASGAVTAPVTGCVPPPRRASSVVGIADAGDELGLDRRDCERIDLASEVLVRPIGGFNFQARLDNVSTAGCKVELMEPAEPGEPMIARFPQLEPLGGEVRWTDGTAAGLQFSRPMHSAVFERLLGRL